MNKTVNKKLFPSKISCDRHQQAVADCRQHVTMKKKTENCCNAFKISLLAKSAYDVAHLKFSRQNS
jgi:hypothetical protein